MTIFGFESYTADDLADMLSGDAIKIGDLANLHSALIVLCRRVGELQAELDKLRSKARLETEAVAR